MNPHLHRVWPNLGPDCWFRSLGGFLGVGVLLAGCGQPASTVTPAGNAPVALPALEYKQIPQESVPSDPKTLAKIAAAFVKTPVRPLPKDADVSQSLRRWQTRTDLWRHVFLDGYRARKSGEETATAQAEKFLEGYCLRVGESPDAPSNADLLKQGDQLDKAQVRDPQVGLALAAILFDPEMGGSPRLNETVKSIEDALHAGQHSPWLTARFHRLKANMNLREEGGGVRREQMELMVKDLLRAAADPALTNIQRRMLVYLFSVWANDFSSGEFKVAVTMNLESAKDLDPWVRAILLSRVYHSAAWSARGGGSFGSLTPETRDRFLHYLEHARRHALRGWELRPELPEAAAELLKITMASKGVAGENVRFWFDEAVQADFNYLDVYLHLAWALRPRWGGSHDQMLAFGHECLMTARFDTDVPFIYHQMVSDVAEERGGLGIVVQFPGVYEQYVYLFDSQAKSTQDDVLRNRHRSRLAAVSYLAGKHDKTREILAELKDQADPQGFELFELSLDEVRQGLELK